MLLILFFAVIFAILGAYLADKMDMDPALWGIICFLFGIFGIIILLIAIAIKGGNKPEEKPTKKSRRKEYV